MDVAYYCARKSKRPLNPEGDSEWEALTPAEMEQAEGAWLKWARIRIVGACEVCEMYQPGEGA